MISIIVPVYNIEKYIEKCILSIVNQTYSNFELLLINDGSTDSSSEICKKWAENDYRIKVFSKENGGVSSARNLGLDLASGNFIFFIDGDDWISPDCLEKLMNHMTADTDLVICECDKIDEKGALIELSSNYKKEQSGEISKLEALYDSYSRHLYARVVWAKLYRKELWKGIRFKSIIYTEDTYAVFQIFENAKKIYYLHESLYFYFQRDLSVSHTSTPQHYEGRLETLYFMYNRALEEYPMCKNICAKEYLAQAYFLLKTYQQRKMKKDAIELIEKMQFVYKTSQIKSKLLANRLLILPKYLIYFLISLKNLISNILD